MTGKRLFSGFMALSLALFSPAYAVEPQSTPTASPTDSGKVRISPEAYESLNPIEQRMVQERFKQEAANAMSSSETKPAQMAPFTQVSPVPEATSSVVPEEISDVERAMSGKKADDIPLKQFGYNLFQNSPSTFAPVDDAPVRDDYVVGPGDEILVSMASPRRNGDYSLIVNRNGTISVPNIGVISVAGLSYTRLVDLLTRKLKGGASEMRLAVRMGKLRSIQVFVVGKVRRPGAYTVSALSNLSNAIMACGGPTKVGSLRNIQLKRNGRTVSQFDFYDFLLQGDSSRDLRLHSGDVIFVPEIGPVVGISGNVREPAIYELRGKTSLTEALKLAGNITPMGYTQQIQIERYSQNAAKTIVDVDMSRLSSAGKTELQDGDLIRISSVNDKLMNGIYLDGNVERPGKYEYRSGMRIRDIIKTEQDLKAESYMEFALIERVTLPDFHIELIPFNLGKALAGDRAENKLLSPRDTIRIYYRWAIQDPPKVRIGGSVHRSGDFFYHPNMTVSELIHLAGGLKDQADITSAELTRVQVVDNKVTTKHITVNVQSAMQGDSGANIPLMKDDYLMIKQVPEYKLYRTVKLEGEVAQPGTYTFQDNETLMDVIKRAGGFTRRAYLKGSIYTRESVKKLQDERLQDFTQKLEADIYRNSSQAITSALSAEAAKANEEALSSKKALLESIKKTKASGRMIVDLLAASQLPHSETDIHLEEGDTLVVPPIINSVSVLGQVYNPTAITYQPGKRVDYYLGKTGNPTENADIGSIYVIKADGSVLTDRNFSTGWLFWKKGVLGATLEPGDTVMVPEKIAMNSSLRDIKDITTILAQIATTVGVTWGVIRQ